MSDQFKPEEGALIKPGEEAPAAVIPEIGSVVDPAKAQGFLYQINFYMGAVPKTFEFRVSTDHSAVMAALFLAIRKYPLVHTVTIVRMEPQEELICYVPLLGLEKQLGPQLVVTGEGPAIQTAKALPAGKTFKELQAEIKLRDGGLRR